LDLLGLKHPYPDRPLDGVSLKKLIVDGSMTERPSPIGSWKYNNKPERSGEPWIADQSVNEMITLTTRQQARRDMGDYSKPDYFLNFKHPKIRKNITDVAVWIDNRFKLVVEKKGRKLELYDLIEDRAESKDIAPIHPEVVQRMKKELEAWQHSVENSLTGADY
jgi:hypothetical protein